MADEGNTVDKLKIEFEIDTDQAKKSLSSLDKSAQKGSRSSSSGKYSKAEDKRGTTQDESKQYANKLSSFKLPGSAGKISGKISSLGGSLAKYASMGGKLGSIVSGIASALAKVAKYAGVIGVLISLAIKRLKIYYGTLVKIIKGTIAIGKAIVTHIAKKFEEIISPIKHIWNRFKGVLLQRALRSLLMQIQNAVKEGLENVAKGSQRANKILSQYSTQLMYLKNTIGAAAIPALEMLYPVFEMVTNAVIKATNGINQFLTLLSGRTRYIKAKRQYVDFANSVDKSSKKAKKSVSNLLAGFDELNDLTESINDSGDSDSMTSYFTTKGIESSVSDFFKRVKAEFKKGDMTGVGAIIANKFNAEIARLDNLVKWENIGLKVVTGINSITSLLNSLLKNINWYGLGELVGDGIDTVFKALVHFEERFNFKGLGAAIAQTLNGLFDNMPWKEIGEHFADKFINIFKILDGFINGDGERNGFSFTNLAKDIVTAINSALIKFTENGELIGRTITDILTAAFTLGSSILVDEKGVTLGAKLGKAINNIIKGMNTKDAIASMGRFLETVIKSFADLVDTINWREIGDAIAEIIRTLNQTNIRNAMKKLFMAVIKAGLTLALDALKTWALEKVKNFINPGNRVVVTVKGTANTSHPGSTRAYATGGFPEDGFFYANSSELVGRFANGRTAVANNEQIISGIESGVYNAMTAALSQQNLGGNVYINGAKAGRVLAESVYGELVRMGVMR